MRFEVGTQVRIWTTFVDNNGVLASVSTPTIKIYNGSTLLATGNMTLQSGSNYYYDYTIANEDVLCAYIETTYSTGEEVKGSLLFIGGEPSTLNTYALFVSNEGESLDVSSPKVSVYKGSSTIASEQDMTQITGSLYYKNIDTAIESEDIFNIVLSATNEADTIYGQYVLGGIFGGTSDGEVVIPNRVEIKTKRGVVDISKQLPKIGVDNHKRGIIDVGGVKSSIEILNKTNTIRR